MRRTRSADNVVSKPTVANESSPGYYANRDVGGGVAGTVVDADELNIIQEEIAAVIEDAGITLDSTGATTDQMSTAIQGYVAALKSDATSITGTTTHLRALLASTNSEADGADTAIVASDTSNANAANAAVMASYKGATVADQSAIIASEQATALKNQIAASSTNAAIVGSLDCNVTNGDQTVVAASDTCDVADGVTEAFVAASLESNPQTSGSRVAVLASNGGIMAASSSSALIATEAAGNVANASASAVIACGGNGDPGEIDNATSSLVAASDDALLSGAAVDSAILASNGATTITAGGTGAAAAETSAAIACYGAELEGTSRSLIAASYGCSIKENLAQAAIIGCASSTMPITTMTATVGVVMLASAYCDAGQNAGTADPPNWSVFGGYHASSLSPNSWRIESNGGYMRSTNAHTTAGLDYAEVMPNADGRAHAPGSFLSHDGDGVSDAAGPLAGLVSVSPTVVGGDDGLGWQGRYLRDEWGGIVHETVEMVRWGGYNGPADEAPCTLKRTKTDKRPLAPANAEASERQAGKVTVERIRWDAYDGPEAMAPERAPASAERYVDTSEGLEIQCIRWPDGDVALTSDSPDYPGAAEVYTTREPAPPVTWLRWDGYDGALVNAPCDPPETAERYTVRQPKLNPDYDPTRPQVSRRDRPDEWTLVGLTGQIRGRVAENVAAGDYAVPVGDGVGGKATLSEALAQSPCTARVLRIEKPYDAEKGYAVALVLVR